MTNRMLRYLLVVASIVIGMFALITPKPIDNESEFSAERAFDHIEQIAKVPHTIEDKDALEDVREYLVSQLNILGVQNEITTYTQEDDEYDITEVNNILVTIDCSLILFLQLINLYLKLIFNIIFLLINFIIHRHSNYITIFVLQNLINLPLIFLYLLLIKDFIKIIGLIHLYNL